MVKKFLSMKGREYEEVSLEDRPELRAELLKKTGVMQVPVTKIGDEYIAGWNPKKLTELIG